MNEVDSKLDYHDRICRDIRLAKHYALVWGKKMDSLFYQDRVDAAILLARAITKSLGYHTNGHFHRALRWLLLDMAGKLRGDNERP